MVAASLARMLTSPSNLAVPSLICSSIGLAPIIDISRSLRLMVRVRSGFSARNPSMLVRVAFSISRQNFSPLSGVMRLMVKRMPSAFLLSIRMPRKLRNNSVDIARTTSGLLELAIAPCGMPVRSS